MPEIIIGVVLVIVFIILVWWISTLNGLKKTQIKIEEASSGIDVALTKRYDVLTKMVQIAKSYAKFEKETILEAVKLRKGMSIAEKNEAAAAMGDVQRGLNILAENYPQLHANENFRQLQVAVMDVEEHLQGARRAYNSNVSTLNQKIVTFPTSIGNTFLLLPPALFLPLDACRPFPLLFCIIITKVKNISQKNVIFVCR